jgi:hypothetical protein
MTAHVIEPNAEQISRFARFFAAHREIRPFDFCSLNEGRLFPTRGQPGVIDYFFFCTAHQFSFWQLKDNRYAGPMVAFVDGVPYKGSDFIWRVATRAWATNHFFFRPQNLVKRSDVDWKRFFQDDAGKNPLPIYDKNREIIRHYVEWFARSNTTPENLVTEANRHPAALQTFLRLAGRVPGYREDPLQKKLQLLAVILENRPEHFLRVTDPQSYRPIVDYHLMRSALRTGLVTVTRPELRLLLERRELVTEAVEHQIRQAVFDAINRLVKESGVSMAAIDYFFFTNRTRCPEMTEPQCKTCPVNQVCARHVHLFQPVFRTTAY